MRLWFGSLFVAVLLFLSITGPYIAPYTPTDKEKYETKIVNGKEVISSPPLPPSEKHLLGTDEWGYDMLTLLLYGARYTVFVSMAIAFFRVLFGIIIGMEIGMHPQKLNWWDAIENAWSYIPLFIPAYFLLLGVNINSSISTSSLVALFIFLVTIIGIPSVVSTIRKNTEHIKKMPFVMAATSLGAGRLHIMFRHVLPQMKEQILILIVTEIISVMILMGYLGVFNMFVGGTKMTINPTLYHSVTYEWAGLIGQYRGYIYGTSKWIFFSPLIAYLFTIASFHLLATGLRNRFEKNYQRAPFI